MDLKQTRGRILPDEAVKAAYRATIRELHGGIETRRRAQLEARLEFLERIYLF